MGLVPGQGTKIPHAAGQLSQCAGTTEPVCSRAHELSQEKPPHHNEDPVQSNKQREYEQYLTGLPTLKNSILKTHFLTLYRTWALKNFPITGVIN